MKVYGDMKSGNCYKVALVCSLLGLDYQWIDVDILAKQTQSEAFIALNPNGKIPLLVLDNGDTLSESNAIINYLASGSALIPKSPFAQAKVQQWQFFEQYSHEPYIAVARYINKYLGLPSERLAEYKDKQEGGHKALKIMDKQLSTSDFLVGNSLSTADISLYAYTHVASEGGFDLSDYVHILAWLKRVEAQPNFLAMT